MLFRSGAFTMSLVGLTASTLYHVKAYAINSAGTVYGPEVTFTTAASSVNPKLAKLLAAGLLD